MYDYNISERIRKGVKIDAPFPQCMVLAAKVIEKECGYSPSIDEINCEKQCDDQFTIVRYMNTRLNQDSKRFQIKYPDRYVPAKETPKGVIRSEDDI